MDECTMLGQGKTADTSSVEIVDVPNVLVVLPSAEAKTKGLDELDAALKGIDALWSKAGVHDRLREATVGVRRQLLLDLANMPAGADAFRWFSRKWRKNLDKESAESCWELRIDLRFIWRRSSIATSQVLLDGWLAWRPPNRLPATENGTPGASGNAESVDKKKRPDYYSPFRCSLVDGKLIPNLLNLRAMLIQGVFEHWNHFKICANTECLAPFYIARRSDQLVCDAQSCKAEKQREYARNWWNENRAKTQDPTKPRTKKGRAGNGTRKTR
jgi:hypothetical protein